MLPDAPRTEIANPPPRTVLELRRAGGGGDVLITVFKWHRLIVAFGLGLMIAAAMAIYLKPPVYAAMAKVLIKGDRGPVIAGLPTSPGRPVYSTELLQTEVEFFRSRSVLMPVARALSAGRGEATGPTESRLLADAAALRSNLTVVPVPNTNVIQATYVSAVPGEPERVLGLIVTHWLEQYAAAYTGSTALSAFFESETDASASTLAAAEERLRRWQEANNVVSLESQIAAQLTAVGELDTALKRVDAELEATRVQIDALGRDIASLPAQSVTSREHVANPLIARLKAELATEEAMLGEAQRNPITDRLRMEISAAEQAVRDVSAGALVTKLKGELVQAELALDDLRQRYMDSDRRIQERQEHIGRVRASLAAAEEEATAAAQARLTTLERELATAERNAAAAVQARMASLRKQLAAAEREGDVVGRQTIAPHPLREGYTRDQAGARARLTSLVSQRDALRGQSAAAARVLTELREKRVQFERLAREVELAKAGYLQNARRLDDARVAADLEKKQLTRIAVLEPAHATSAGRGMRQMAMVPLLGLMVGLGLGVATAFGFEFVNGSIRTREDVEFYLGVPVLAAVPAFPRPAGQARPLPPARRRPPEADGA